MQAILLAMTAAFLGILSGCSFAPTYKTPSSVRPADVYAESGAWQKAEPQDAQSRGVWWEQFGDPELNSLEVKVGSGNQNIQAGFARLQEARAATRVARAGLFPTLDVGSSATRQRISQNSPAYLTGHDPTFNNFDLEADLSYEIDLWGRVRNTVSAAKAGQQASAADLAALALAQHAELATDYYALRSEDSVQLLLENTVDDYAKSLALTEHLYEGGAAAMADVDQARAQLEGARTLLADNALLRTQTEHAIAVLIGENPSRFHVAANPLPEEIAPPPFDVGLPSTLLERRPDVAVAERRVAAANAQIGVAQAAYFPVFSLTAAAGFDSTRPSTWLNAPSRLWGAGPSGLLTVFDAGRHRAESAQAHAQYDEQVANYRNTVLVAYQEVEDNLAALRRLDQESQSEAAAVAATAKALEQARYRYKAGLVTYLEVSTTESIALQAQLIRANIQARHMQASVLLVKALGGGWRRDSFAQTQTPAGATARNALPAR
jgi:NodT family efflux transporter outer membrane factor (OMF) lipoprotein